LEYVLCVTLSGICRAHAKFQLNLFMFGFLSTFSVFFFILPVKVGNPAYRLFKPWCNFYKIGLSAQCQGVNTSKFCCTEMQAMHPQFKNAAVMQPQCSCNAAAMYTSLHRYSGIYYPLPNAKPSEKDHLPGI
jgi:hypothetical protein